MQFLDKHGLGTFLAQLKNIFGRKAVLDKSIDARNQYLLEIDYDNTLKFDTDFIVGGSASSAVVGIATCGTVVVGNS